MKEACWQQLQTYKYPACIKHFEIHVAKVQKVIQDKICLLPHKLDNG
jgi:hypothetical protein